MTPAGAAGTASVGSKRMPPSKRLNPGLNLQQVRRHQEMTMKHMHEWVVYSTAILDRCLLLQCVGCGALATVDDPTTREWAKAFHAPSRPYLWDDEARVHVRREPPCPFFVIRAKEGGPACPCPPRPGAQGRREYERFPGEIVTPGEALTEEEKEELEGLAGVVSNSELCSLLFPDFIRGIQEDMGREPAGAVRRIAGRIERIHSQGLHCSPRVVARVLREFIRPSGV
jgi:hypothetical protein